MTTATKTTTILGHQFDLDECHDICRGGCQAGVPGFTYTSDCLEAFNEHRETVLERLTELADDLGEESCYSIAEGSLKHHGYSVPFDPDLITLYLVWIFVEDAAYQFCCEARHPDYV